jgi:multidrug efflux pump subunit AcrA (membrane-fusion protein)
VIGVRASLGLLLLVLVPVYLASQESDLLIDEPPNIPEEFEDSVRDLIERYEELQRLLRAQLRRAEELYTQEELDQSVAEVEAQIERLQRELSAAREENKALRTMLKNTRDEATAVKAVLSDTRGSLRAEIQYLQRTIDGIEDERLLTVASTFSPAGSLGALGIINFPGSNVGLLAGSTYFLREQDLQLNVGVTLNVFPQQRVVSLWTRLFAPDAEPGETAR